MPIGFPQGSVYNPVIDEHLPYGVDTPHNLTAMELFPTQKNNGVVHPTKMVNKSAPLHGSPMKIFQAFIKPQSSTPVV